jgi:streptogramin lyase
VARSFKRLPLAFLTPFLLLASLPAPRLAAAGCCADGSGTITTIAGNGVNAYAGDGLPALGNAAGQPLGVALGPDGSIYFSDRSQGVVRAITPAGLYRTVAGTGAAGYSGDGGPATAAQIGSNCGLAVGPGGDLYIADPSNSAVRRVDTAGIIHAFAGTGSPGFSGDGGPALAAQLDYCYFVATNAAGDVLICDSGNGRLRKVDPAGIISTVAGPGVDPEGLAFTPAGDLYFWDDLGHNIDLLTAGGALSVYVPSGAITLGDIHGMAYCGGPGPAGTIICGSGNPALWGYSGDGGPASAAMVDWPYGVLQEPNGDYVFSDLQNDRIRRISTGCPMPSPTATPTVSPTASPTPSVTATVTPDASPTDTPSVTRTLTVTLSPTVTPSVTRSVTQTVTPTRTPTTPPLALHPYPPNPDPVVGGDVHLPYWLNCPARVSIAIFDVSGEKVRSLDPLQEPLGVSEEAWDLRNGSGARVASGVYLVRYQADAADGDRKVAFEKCAVLR